MFKQNCYVIFRLVIVLVVFRTIILQIRLRQRFVEFLCYFPLAIKADFIIRFNYGRKSSNA